MYPLNLTPSSLRTYEVVLPVSGFTAELITAAPKASGDDLDYTLDFTQTLLGTMDAPASVSIRSITGQSDSGQYPLTAIWANILGASVTVFLTSGKPYNVYTILAVVKTNQGRIINVPMQIGIDNASPATLPTDILPSDITLNGGVAMAGKLALPPGYSSNGSVVMGTEEAAPVGTPSFESVTAGTYMGDGSGLNVTADSKTQTIAEWIASLASGGTDGKDGVGIVSITASQDTIIVGQLSKVTLTALLTDGTTSVTTFEAPPGSDGVKGDTGATGATGPTGATGATGASLKSIEATQGTVTAGEASTVTLTATLTDGTTASAGTFESPAGATGAAGDTGVGIASVAVSQGTVTAGQPSTVTLTATMTNGTTAPGVSFDAPAGASGATGAAGSDASVTAANVEAALGYTPADPAKTLQLSPSSSDALQNIIAPSNSTFGNSYAFGVEDTSGNILQVGCVSSYGYKWFSIKSTDGNPGLQIVDNEGNGTSNGLTLHLSSDGTEIVSSALGINAEYGGSFRFVNKDDKKLYWQITPSAALSSGNSNLNIVAGSTDGSAWQAPVVSLNPTTNTATFLNEPVTTTTYTYATLPTSPADWQRALVTDKAIGSGTQGVMAMYNPTSKTWTGLGGEALV